MSSRPAGGRRLVLGIVVGALLIAILAKKYRYVEPTPNLTTRPTSRS